VIPTFGTLFGEPIPPYFVLLSVAFMACAWVGVRWARREGHDSEVIIDLALVSVISGVAGARLAHVFLDGFFWDYVHLCTDPSQVSWPITQSECLSEAVAGRWDVARSVCVPTHTDCFAWAKFWQGGLTWYGGMVLGIAYGVHFLRKEKFPLWKGLDYAGMVLPLGLFFGRLGCFFGGCCFGSPTEAWYGVSFPGWSPASEEQWRAHLLSSPSLASLPVIPTQLLEAAGSLAIAAWAILYAMPRKRFDGQVICAALSLYAVLRFGLEFLRADDRGGVWALSSSQWIGFLVIAVAAAVYRPLARRARSIESRA
jgi:phosphatidylglycerol---prolipoprotein diacylglyceryl transferase